MPIKKRITPPVKGSSRKGLQYAGGVSIEAAIRKLDQQISDAEWDGSDETTVNKLRERVSKLRARRDEGEVYI